MRDTDFYKELRQQVLNDNMQFPIVWNFQNILYFEIEILKNRKKNPLTQKQFAEIVGVGEDKISKWKNGTNAPHDMNKYKLSQALGVKWEYLEGLSLNRSLNEEENDLFLDESTPPTIKQETKLLLALAGAKTCYIKQGETGEPYPVPKITNGRLTIDLAFDPSKLTNAFEMQDHFNPLCMLCYIDENAFDRVYNEVVDFVKYKVKNIYLESEVALNKDKTPINKVIPYDLAVNVSGDENINELLLETRDANNLMDERPLNYNDLIVYQENYTKELKAQNLDETALYDMCIDRLTQLRGFTNEQHTSMEYQKVYHQALAIAGLLADTEWGKRLPFMP